MDREGRKAIVPSFYVCAHFSKRSHDARHRPPRERFISADASDKRLGREDTGKHSNSRARVSCVERARRLAKPIQPLSIDARLSVPDLDFSSHTPHPPECGLAIRAAGIVVDLRDTFGYPGQAAVAMRNRFVAGKLDGAADGAGRTDLLPHGIRVSVTE